LTKLRLRQQKSTARDHRLPLTASSSPQGTDNPFASLRKSKQGRCSVVLSMISVGHSFRKTAFSKLPKTPTYESQSVLQIVAVNEALKLIGSLILVYGVM
jgi:hypothetical protein